MPQLCCSYIASWPPTNDTVVACWHVSDLTVGEDVDEQRKKRKQSHRPLSALHWAPRTFVKCPALSFNLRTTLSGCLVIWVKGLLLLLLFFEAMKWTWASAGRCMPQEDKKRQQNKMYFPGRHVMAHPPSIYILFTSQCSNTATRRVTADDNPVI